MDIRRSLRISQQIICLLSILTFSPSLHASFIESTMGAAVVNDATAVYYNPAALVLLNNAQLICLDSEGRVKSEFSGQFMRLILTHN